MAKPQDTAESESSTSHLCRTWSKPTRVFQSCVTNRIKMSSADAGRRLRQIRVSSNPSRVRFHVHQSVETFRRNHEIVECDRHPKGKAIVSSSPWDWQFMTETASATEERGQTDRCLSEVDMDFWLSSACARKAEPVLLSMRIVFPSY